jgi:hypothetical protein
LIDDEQWNDVNVITGVLKAWFREVPTPLMTFDLYPEFIALAKSQFFFFFFQQQQQQQQILERRSELN